MRRGLRHAEARNIMLPASVLCDRGIRRDIGIMAHAEQLITIYGLLDAHFGYLNWWPGETPFEIAIGAILTQNTSWKNVETAIERLKAEQLMSVQALSDAEEHVVAESIRSSGYYNQKTQRLKGFVRFLMDVYGGSMAKMFQEELWELRRKLLAVKGIGEETADSILLYAGGKPIFVVDAYTRRILERHDIHAESLKYREIQEMFMRILPEDAAIYNQYHALLVNTGKHYCRKNPLCESCPLQGMTHRQ
jgi:endonuclease-3 related protein